jgi:hypothetical protein
MTRLSLTSRPALADASSAYNVRPGAETWITTMRSRRLDSEMSQHRSAMEAHGPLSRLIRIPFGTVFSRGSPIHIIRY